MQMTSEEKEQVNSEAELTVSRCFSLNFLPGTSIFTTVPSNRRLRPGYCQVHLET